MIKVMPAEGKKIRDPVTHLYIDETDGLEVDEKDLYWFRRLRDGDVVMADAPPEGGEGGEGGDLGEGGQGYDRRETDWNAGQGEGGAS